MRLTALSRSQRMILVAAAALGVLAVVTLGRLSSGSTAPRRFVLAKSPSHAACTIEEGWSADQVSAECGQPQGGGSQPKIGARTAGTGLLLCSAPCEVFGDTLVLYGCDEKVWETQALTGPWRCSIDMRDEGWERGDE